MRAEEGMTEAARKRSVVVGLRLPRARRVRGHVTGWVVSHDARGLVVDYDGNPHGPLAARATVPVGEDQAALDPGARREVLLVFEHERSDEPIVVGWLEPGPAARAPATGPAPAPGSKVEAKVDGRRVVIEAEDEIELRCGEATLTLRRNGRVVIRGVYVETRARGVNRVRGGVVQIN
jgi:hypothetical protein